MINQSTPKYQVPVPSSKTERTMLINLLYAHVRVTMYSTRSRAMRAMGGMRPFVQFSIQAIQVGTSTGLL